MKNMVPGGCFDSNIKVRQFRYHLASTGTLLADNDVIRLMKMPSNAVIVDIHIKNEAGGGTNTTTVRYGKVSDDSVTHGDIKVDINMGSAAYWRLSDETAAAATILVEPGYEFYLELEVTGSSGWPVDKYIKGAVFYYVPSFDDEITDEDD